MLIQFSKISLCCPQGKAGGPQQTDSSSKKVLSSVLFSCASSDECSFSERGQEDQRGQWSDEEKSPSLSNLNSPFVFPSRHDYAPASAPVWLSRKQAHDILSVLFLLVGVFSTPTESAPRH